jgi:hypothetical protein
LISLRCLNTRPQRIGHGRSTTAAPEASGHYCHLEHAVEKIKRSQAARAQLTASRTDGSRRLEAGWHVPRSALKGLSVSRDTRRWGVEDLFKLIKLATAFL